MEPINGTCDLRMFSALFFILRTLTLASYLRHHYEIAWPLLWSQVVVGVFVSCLITITRPQQRKLQKHS